jgi:hypothetical protein
VDLSNTTSPLNVEWLSPASGARTSAGTVAGGSAAQSFTPPFSGDAVLYLVDSNVAPASDQPAPPPPDMTPPSSPVPPDVPPADDSAAE